MSRCWKILMLLVLIPLAPAGSIRADLLGLYTFDDGTAADSSGNDNHGTIVGAPFPETSGGAIDDGGYFNFTGNSYVQTLVDINPDTYPQLTMGAWARVTPGTAPEVRQVIAHDDGGWDRGLGIDLRGDADGNGDTNYRWTGFTGNGPLGDTTPVDTEGDEWVFVAGVYDADDSLTKIFVDDEVYDGQAVHATSHFNLRIGSNPCCGEFWLGDIDNVFVFDEALEEDLVLAIGAGGLDVINTLAERPPVTLSRNWTFEDGTLDDFSIVEGFAFDNQPTYGDNPLERNAGVVSPFGTGIEGDYFIGTFENRPTEDDFPGDVQGDGPVGVIESDTFVLEAGARIDFRIGGGRHPWDFSWEPDSGDVPIDDSGPTTLNLEWQVDDDQWEVAFSATGLNDESLHFGYWDASELAGETVRLRIYDNNTGGWGHVNVDNIRYFVAGESLLGDFNGDGELNGPDIDQLTEQVALGSMDLEFDVTQDGSVDQSDIVFWVKDLAETWIGDANVDKEFNSSDLVSIFAVGSYEMEVPAVWSEGDWTGDGRFGSSDLVAAFTDGGYEQGPATGVCAVPEPSGIALSLTALVAFMSPRRHTSSKST